MAANLPIEVVSAGLIWRNRILLVKRGKEPSKGLFAFPGGRVESNETMDEAVRREVQEETGLQPENLEFLETINLRNSDLISESGDYRLHVFHGNHSGGEPTAGDDADEAGWFTLEQLETMPLTDSSLRIARKLLS